MPHNATGVAVRILHIIPTTNPSYGGPVEGVRQYGQKALAMGHSIEILCLDSAEDPHIAKYPLKVHAIGPSQGKYSYNKRLKPWLDKHHGAYDAIVINGLWMYHSFGAWRSLRKSKKPYFVFTHGMLDPWFKRTYPLKHLKKWLYWPWAEYRVLRDAAGVLFTCEQERLLARESFWLYKAKESVVNYGAGSPPDGDLAVLRQSFLAAHPTLQSQEIFLFLGRIHEKKGADLLIRAFAATCKDRANCCLVFAGPGHSEYTDLLKGVAEDLGISGKVYWTGLLTGEMKWGAFASADVFCLPSHQENFGIAVAESLACGVPVLISNQVNIWREIELDGAGIVFSDTTDGTASGLRRWLSLTSDEKSAMRESALRCFSSRFTASAMAESITLTISAVIDKNKENIH